MLAVACANTEPLAATHNKTASPTLFNIPVSSCSRSNERRPDGIRGRDVRTNGQRGQARTFRSVAKKINRAGARTSECQIVTTANGSCGTEVELQVKNCKCQCARRHTDVDPRRRTDIDRGCACKEPLDAFEAKS